MTGVSVTDARKRKEQKKDNVVLTSERHEIDNFDFLYNDTEYDGYNNKNVSFTENLMDEAFSHIGTRYRHGAKGPSANHPVNRRDLQTGDLVFFTGRNARGGVGHVGIVVDVNADGTFTFIHASTSKGVRVSESTESYYVNRYVGARRVM